MRRRRLPRSGCPGTRERRSVVHAVHHGGLEHRFQQFTRSWIRLEREKGCSRSRAEAADVELLGSLCRLGGKLAANGGHRHEHGKEKRHERADNAPSMNCAGSKHFDTPIQFDQLSMSARGPGHRLAVIQPRQIVAGPRRAAQYQWRPVRKARGLRATRRARAPSQHRSGRQHAVILPLQRTAPPAPWCEHAGLPPASHWVSGVS
jgi:hypothetical protein